MQLEHVKSEFSDYNYKATEQKDLKIKMLQNELESINDHQMNMLN